MRSRPGAGDARHAERDELIVADRHLALGGEQRLRLEHQHRIRGAQRRLHQALGVGGVGRHADDQAGDVRPHRVVGAAVVRPGAADAAHADAHHHRRVHLAVAHVAELGGLQHDLAGRLEQEVGEHEVGDGAGAGGRGAEGGAGEALLGDRRIDHPLRAELVVEVPGVGEGAAALAGALAEIEDVRVAPHLLGDAVADGIEPALLHHLRRGGRTKRLGRVDRLGIDMVRDGRRVRLGAGAGEGQRLAGRSLDAGVDRVEIGGGDAELADEPGAEQRDRIALQPGVHLLLGAVGAGDVVALVVADGAVGLGLDQRRALAGAGALDGGARNLEHGEDVVAVDRDAGDAIGGGLAGDLGIEGRLGERRRRGVEIVLADEDDRRLLDAGEVHRLVEAAVVDRAVAEEGDADVVAALGPGADAGAGGVADAGGDDAVGAEQADRAIVEMHGAAAAAAAALDLAEQLGHQDVGIHALGEGVAMAAMGRGHPVGGAEMGADADGGRLLADIEMEEAGGLALAAGDLGKALEASQQHHLLVERQEQVAAIGRHRRRLAARHLASSGHGLPRTFHVLVRRARRSKRI